MHQHLKIIGGLHQNILQQNPHDAYSITHLKRNIEDTVGQALSGHSPDA